MLPDAPPTASSDSTSGTPAANIVCSVRVQRAIVAFSRMPPTIGSLSDSRCTMKRTLSDRLIDSRMPTNTATIAMNIAHHHATKKSEMSMTTCVSHGRLAPKLENTLLNAGITKIMITHVTTIATTMTEIG